MAALAITVSRAQTTRELEYDSNFDSLPIVTKMDNTINPLWVWDSKEGPAIDFNNFDSMIIPNNQVALMKDVPMTGSDNNYTPVMKGGALSYTVDLSHVDCGCVAGAYAVSI